MDFEYYPKGYDNFKIFLYKKIERISLALYLCTEHLEESVSLKTSIRTLADTILKDIINFNRGHENISSTTKIKESFLEIKSLIGISISTHLINQNNGQILLDEIAKISREIENQKDNFIGHEEFKKSFFVVESRHKMTETFQNQNTDNKGHKGQIESAEILPEVTKNKENHKGQTKNLNTNDRTEEILKIIKDNEEVTIKDIAVRVKGYSEKTIQRELLKMVSLKMIKKEGERRWSTYSIK